MDELRPTHKQKNIDLNQLQNPNLTSDDLYGSPSIRDISPDFTTLPSCVLLRSTIPLEQKQKDNDLPRFIHELDEACRHGIEDAKKWQLATSCVYAASFPNRKYRLLDFYKLLDSNKDKPNVFNILGGALVILEKYATNLLKKQKHHLWRVVKFNLDIMQRQVLNVAGALDILHLMGYTNKTENALTFPVEVQQPNVNVVVVLASDLVIARAEVDIFFKNKHPFLLFCPSVNVVNPNVVQKRIEIPNMQPQVSVNPTQDFCGVCSEQNVAIFCGECDMKFCNLCDERWHLHVLRRNHIRSNLVNPVLAQKTDVSKTNRPVPAPRLRKRQPDILSATKTPGQLIMDISPNQQEIKHPPIGPGVNPGYTGMDQTGIVNVSRVAPHQVNTGMPAEAAVTLKSKFTSSLDRSMGQSEPYNENTSIAAQMAASGLYRSCPHCSLLILSNEASCPSCQLTTGQRSPSPDFRKGSSSLSPGMDYQQQSYNSGQLFSNTDPSRVLENILPSKNSPEPLYEEIDEMQSEWSCEYCTFHNPITTKICQVCYKTPSDLNKSLSASKSLSATSKQTKLGTKDQQPVKKERDILYSTFNIKDSPHEGFYMTPKNRPLQGGIYMAPTHLGIEPPPLPPRMNDNKQLPQGGKEVILPQAGGGMKTHQKEGNRWVDSQKSRERQLSEKEMGKKQYEEKERLFKGGLITEEEFYDTEFDPSDVIKMRQGLDQARIPQLIQAGQMTEGDLFTINQSTPQNPRNTDLGQKLAPSDDELLRLLQDSVISEQPVSKLQRNVQQQNIVEPPRRNRHETLSNEELINLYKAGFITLKELQEHQNPKVIPQVQEHQAPKVMPQDVNEMLQEFEMLQTTYGSELNEMARVPSNTRPNKTTFSDVYNYRVTQDLPRPISQGFYDKTFTNGLESSTLDCSSKCMSLPNFLGTRGSYGFLEQEGRMYIEWMKQAETFGFTPEELNLATNLSWQDSKNRNPVEWLKEEWTSRLAEVIDLVYQQTTDENDRIGNISADEAKQALVENHGSVESACKACIESRREKLARMSEVAVYSRADCLNALDNSNGDLENALLELEMKALEPMRRRVLGTADVEDGSRTGNLQETNQKFNVMLTNKQITLERRARIILAEKKLLSWGRAETAVKLIDEGFDVADAIEASKAYGDMERSRIYLEQECPVCMDVKPMGQMITYLNCQDRICKDCITEYLTNVIKEKNIHHLVCPVCTKPDLTDEDEATEFFNNLDIMMREFVGADIHDLFQQKLRDRTLSKEPNFRWCAHCAFGFINEAPNVPKMICPSCQKYTCFNCKRQWEPQHDDVSCEAFARWKEDNDEAYQQEGLAGHLARNGIDCPNCKFRYDLARGGCMHFKCYQCTHEFCSGCFNPMKHGSKCRVSPNCAKKGLHAHHPRDCLFYLRDWTPQRLQQLLDTQDVDYHVGERRPQDEEGAGAVGAVGGEVAQRVCKVLLQKETVNGLEDAECGTLCENGHEGLCKVHYKEYLVGLINRNAIDPSDLMDIEELKIVLGRAEIAVPQRQGGEDEEVFKDRVLNLLKARLPLGRQPVVRRLEDENESEDESDEEALEVRAENDIPLVG